MIEVERHVAEFGVGQPANLHDRAAAVQAAGHVVFHDDLAQHQLDQLFAGGDFAARLGAHHLAVAQHGHVVADLEDFIQAVGDIDDCDALLLQIGDDLKKTAHLLRRERGRRFIHDNDIRLAGQRFGDLHDLALGDAQILDQALRVDRAVDPVEDLEHTGVTRHRPEDAKPGLLDAETDVLFHPQLLHHIELLEEHTDPRAHGIPGGSRAEILAVVEHLSRSFLVRAGQDLDERGFSCAVLADQAVTGAALDFEADLVQRLDAREVL